MKKNSLKQIIKINAALVLLIIISAVRTYVFSIKNCSRIQGIFRCSVAQEKGLFGFFDPVKQDLSEKAKKYLPSPHSELVLGMTVGLDELKMSPKFQNALKRTGTIHVVVVSGFNMSLIANYALKIFGSPYKLRNLVLTIITTFLYAAFTGFEPPVLRAWVMSTFMLLGKHSGRLLNSLRLLIVSYFVVLIINPSNFYSASTYLSFLATFGLVVLSDPINNFLNRVVRHKWAVLGDISASLAAQIMVWPLISGIFGQVSLISLLVNALVLWTVPVTTVIGILAIILPEFPGRLVWLACFPFCDFFIRVVNYFSGMRMASVEWKMPLFVSALYYTFFLVLTVYLVRRKDRK